MPTNIYIEPIFSLFFSPEMGVNKDSEGGGDKFFYPPPAEWKKERMAKISITWIRKPIELL